MLEYFVIAWDGGAREKVRDAFRAKFPGGYGDVVQETVRALAAHMDEDTQELPDPERITRVASGDYQGAYVYVICAQGSQTRTFWVVKVSYGSCSGCDTLQRIRSEKDWDDESPGATEGQLKSLTQLALHIVQRLKEV